MLGREPRVHAGTLLRIRWIGEALFTTRVGPPSPERLDWLVRELEDFLAHASGMARVMFTVLVWITSTVAPLLVGRLRSLGSLAPADRIAALQALERRFGEPLVPVKAILCLVYYEHPDAGREIGFDGTCRLPRAKAGE